MRYARTKVLQYVYSSAEKYCRGSNIAILTTLSSNTLVGDAITLSSWHVLDRRRDVHNQTPEVALFHAVN